MKGQLIRFSKNSGGYSASTHTISPVSLSIIDDSSQMHILEFRFDLSNCVPLGQSFK